MIQSVQNVYSRIQAIGNRINNIYDLQNYNVLGNNNTAGISNNRVNASPVRTNITENNQFYDMLSNTVNNDIQQQNISSTIQSDSISHDLPQSVNPDFSFRNDLENNYSFTTTANSTPNTAISHPVASSSAAYNAYRTVSAQTSDSSLTSIVESTAEKYGLDPNLLKSIVKAESSFNPNAVSVDGAMGLMQLMPDTAEWLGVNDAFNPSENVDAGARYFKSLLGRFGEIDMALAAYNAGPTRVAELGEVPDYPETLSFINRI